MGVFVQVPESPGVLALRKDCSYDLRKLRLGQTREN